MKVSKKSVKTEFPKVVMGIVFLSICKCGAVFFTGIHKSCLECRLPRYHKGK